MVVEMIIIGIFAPPYMDFTISGDMLHGAYVYSIESLINIMTSLRVYEVLKIDLLLSFWKSKEVYELGKQQGIKFNSLLIIRAYLKMSPARTIMYGIFSTVLIAGFAVHNLERSYESSTKSPLNFEFITNGYWLSIITLTTVGYGDAYPSTHLGRGVMIVTAIIGTTFISIYIVTLYVLISFNKQETNSFHTILQQKNERKLKAFSSNIIKACFRIKKIKESQSESGDLIKHMTQCMNLKAKLQKSDKLSIAHHTKAISIIFHLEDKVIKDLDEMHKIAIRVNYVGERLNDLLQNQKRMNLYLDTLNDEIMKVKEYINDDNITKLLNEINLG